jgi:hypothetical protein
LWCVINTVLPHISMKLSTQYIASMGDETKKQNRQRDDQRRREKIEAGVDDAILAPSASGGFRLR